MRCTRGPGCPPSQVEVFGRVLRPGTARSFVEHLSAHGHECFLTEEGLVSSSAGLSVWVPDIVELGLDGEVETLLQIPPNYYGNDEMVRCACKTTEAIRPPAPRCGLRVAC